ncbi:MAG: hypothetical protein IPG04_16625 [Polyangiaceae bacterium]|nr:hypothetical protein [Polyangiaceae bacterium]
MRSSPSQGVWPFGSRIRLALSIRRRAHCVRHNRATSRSFLRLLAEEADRRPLTPRRSRVMVLSDSDSGRTKLDPFDPIGPGQPGRQLDHVRLGKRLRASRFRLVDFNWQKPALDMKVEAKVDGDDNLGIDAYPGLYPDEPKQGELLAKEGPIDRLQTEARFADVATTNRLVGAGSIFG